MLSPGSRLGPYEILSSIGAGGMGEVYKARDTRLDRAVAIKVLPAHVASDPDVRQRFEREARAVAALNHPHICTLHDIGTQDGTDFLVMEYLEGETLQDRLAKGALPLNQALRYGIEIADALDKAHRAGIVHRDLKPGNVMLTKSGAKLLDFGLAKTGASVVAGTGLSMLPTAPPNLTAQGTILGTFQYMAPEQLEGQEADARTDNFAFGAVLYEMLTGKKAFEGKSQASLIAAILNDDPPAVSELQPVAPPALDHVVKTSLAKSPDDRWQNASDIGRQLAWIGQRSHDLREPDMAVARLPTHRVNRVMAGAVLVLALALLGVSTSIVGRLREPAGPRPIRFAVPLPDGTALSGQVPPISVSPDGRSVAFTASTDRINQIWVHRLDELTSRALPGTDGAQTGAWPIWSPDSTSIAFVAVQGESQPRTLKRIDVSGGLATEIGLLPPGVRTAIGGTWNRDGQILLAGATGGLVRVSVATSTFVPVVFETEAIGNEMSPVFLPDGRRFLYSLQSDVEPGIYIGALDSGRTRRLLPHMGTVQFAEGLILYSRDGAVVAQPFDARNETLTGVPVVVVNNVLSTARSGRAGFSVSENGVLAYSPGAFENSQFVLFSRNGEQLGTIGESRIYRSFSISPDDRSLAAAVVDRSGNVNLWSIELARQVTTRLTFGQVLDAEPRWSPDGTRLIYRSARGGDVSLFEIPSTGGEPRLVLKSPPGRELFMDAWAPDGKAVLFHTPFPPQLLADSRDGAQKPSLVYEPAAGGVDQAVFSPDGKWIALRSSESGQSQIYVIPFPPTAAKWQVSRDGGVQPQWRRDGRELFFLALDGTMMAVDVRTDASFVPGTPSALFQTTLVSPDASPYAVTGDGQRFVLTVSAGPAQANAIQVISDWPELLRRP
jgi:serine/threonine protein kinase